MWGKIVLFLVYVYLSIADSKSLEDGVLGDKTDSLFWFMQVSLNYSSVLAISAHLARSV